MRKARTSKFRPRLANKITITNHKKQMKSQPLNTKNKVIVVVGPTGSGKTEYAKTLAGKTPNQYELINSDSVQIYKELNIGSDKGKVEKYGGNDMTIKASQYEINPWCYSDLKTVPLWLINFVSVKEELNSPEFQKIARKVISNIHSRGKIPIIVGGSGLYTAVTIFDYNFENIKDNKTEYRELSKEELQGALESAGFDLDSLNNSDRNNPRRLVNYLFKINSKIENDLSRKAFKAMDTEQKTSSALYEIELHSLDCELDLLEEKLQKRVNKMLEEGLISEVENLLKHKKVPEKRLKHFIGYQEVLVFLKGETGEDVIVRNIVASHRRLAKKQLTWNKKYFQNFS